VAGLGIFGGTFDPPHLGHFRAASVALEALELDELLWVVAYEPYQREAGPEASAADRLAMVEAACSAQEQFRASDIEVLRGGPSYSVDTVRALAEADPHRRLVLIVGADLVDQMPSWHEAEALASLVELAVVPRPREDYDADGSLFTIREVPVEPVDLSSTELRLALAARESVAGMLDPAVIRVIEERGLYGWGT